MRELVAIRGSGSNREVIEGRAPLTGGIEARPPGCDPVGLRCDDPVVLAALMAAEGYEGPVEVIEGKEGFEHVLPQIELKPEILLAAQLRQTYPKIAIVAHHTTMFAGRALASIEDVARLRARPVTTFCIRCKTKLESQEKLVSGF